MTIHNVLIIEDVKNTATWLSALVREVFSGCQIHMADSVHSARRLIEDSPAFDLALVDLGLPDGSGIGLIPLLRQWHPQCLRVVSTIFADDEHLFPALQAGAQGYVLKDEAAPRLRRALEGIVGGEPPLSAAIAQRVLQTFSPGPSTLPAEDEAALGPRERELLQLIAKGYKLPEAAQHMGITHNTGASYLKSVYRKLGVNSRAEATLAAARMGLVNPGLV